jgi:hypothetical protein
MIVQLPGGYFDADGRQHRETELRALSGRSEELLCTPDRSPAELVTAVLADCVLRIGDLAPVDAALTRDLTVGDRSFLLLKLREATFGQDVALAASCAWPDCGEKVDIAFRISDIPFREPPVPGPVYEVQLSFEAAPDVPAAAARTVRFRLPTGADQEACATLLDRNPAAALRALLATCLTPNEDPTLVATLTPLAKAEIEAAMAAMAGGPALTMRASCPACGRGFDIPFDVADFFFGNVAASSDLLLRQVHYLAFHYHWAESEILDLPRERRLRYVELLAEEIERMNDAVG